MKIYANLGKFDLSGIAPGGGHAVSISQDGGVAIPPRRRQVEINWQQVEELQKWSEELRKKFESR